MRRISDVKRMAYGMRLLAVRRLMLGLAAAAVMSSEAGAVSDWSFETITQIALPPAISGCTAPEVRLTGLDYDPRRDDDPPSGNRPVVGWGEKNNCAAGASLTQDLKWSRRSGAWGGGTLGSFPGTPELAVSPGGVPFYVYAAPGTGADSGNTYVWQQNLDSSATTPIDLFGATSVCTTTPFIATDFTTAGILPSWVRGATCAAFPSGPVKLNASVEISAMKSILALDYAIGTSGVNHVVFHDGAALFYSPGTARSATSILTTTQLRGVSIAVDVNNTVHLVTGDVDTNQMLYMKPPPSGSGPWTQEVLDAAGGRNPSITIDPSGNPCVSYWQPPDQVRFGCKTGSGWDIQRVTTSAAGSNSNFSQPTETRLIFDHATSPKPRILAYRTSSNALNPSGFELLLLSNADLAPVVGTVANQTNNEGDPVLLNIAALSSDEPGDTLSYSVVGLPSGLGIGAANGLITGTLQFDAFQIGPIYKVTVSVSDGTLVTSISFNWTVNDVNRAPTISCPVPTPTINEGTTISPSIQVMASDLDGNSLLYGLSVLPSALWLTISSGGVIGGQPPFTAAGSYTLTLSVTDNIAPTVTINCLWTVNNVNGPPSISTIPNQTSNEGHTVPGLLIPSPGIQVVASDPDNPPATPMAGLIFTALGFPGGPAGGLLINSSSGLITGTLSFSSASPVGTPHIVTVQVCESGAQPLCASTQFTWTVNPVNQPPTINLIDPQTASEGSSITPLQVIASDGDGTTPTLTASGLPPGLSMSPSGLITGTPPFSTNVGPPFPSSTPFTVTISANDGVITVQRTFQWTVNNQNAPPVGINPGPQNSTENTTVSLQIVASDPDNPTATPTTGLTYAIFGQPLPLTISATGVISGTPPLSLGSFTVTVTVTDPSNAQTSVIFPWSVSNVNQPPVFTGGCPPAVNEGSSIIPFTFGSTDPDSDTLQWSATLLPPGLSINTTNGEVTGVATFTSAGSHPIVITVSDGVTSLLKNCTWVVNNTNGPPTPLHPGDQSIGSGVPLSLTVTATDPDIPTPGDTLTFTLGGGSPSWVSISAGGVLTGSTIVAGTYTVTVIVTDLAGLSNSVVFHVSVGSTNLPPVFGAGSPPATETSTENSFDSLQIQASDPDNNPLTYALSGLPAGATINIGGLIEWTPSYTDAGVYTATVTITDTAGLSVQRNITWTVNQSNRVPSFPTPTGAQNNAENSIVDLLIAITDLDITNPNTQNPNVIDDLTCSVINLPPGLSINTQTCRITGTVDFSAFNTAPSYLVKVTVTDSPAGTSTTIEFTWNITNTNRVPTLNKPADRIHLPPGQINIEGATITSFLLVANDADPSDTLIYSATGLPPGVSLDTATGAIASTGNLPLSFTSAGTYPVTACVQDRTPVGSDGFTVCQNFSWTIANTNLTPVLSQPLTPQSVCEGAFFSLFLSGSDPDLNDLLTYGSGNISTPGVLTALGLSINPTTGEISGTIPYTAARVLPYGITVMVTDNGVPKLSSSTKTFTVTVCNTNRPPVFTLPPASANAAENTSFELDINATDLDLTDLLTYSATGLPSWLTIDPDGTLTGFPGKITGTPPYTSAGAYPLTVCVQDRNPIGTDGLKVCHNFTLAVANTDRPPTVTNPGPQANKEDDALSFLVVAFDVDTPDRGDILTYSASNLPPGLNINPVTGYIYGIVTLTASNPLPYPVVITVSDGQITTTVAFPWTITRNRPCEVVRLCHRTIVPADGRRVPIRFRRVSRSSRVVIDKIEQDEPTNLAGSDGTTIDAGGIGLSRGWVRAERDSNGNGRVYRVYFTLTDRLGRKYSCVLKVGVPPTSGGAAIDDALVYDSRLPST